MNKKKKKRKLDNSVNASPSEPKCGLEIQEHINEVKSYSPLT